MLFTALWHENCWETAPVFYGFEPHSRGTYHSFSSTGWLRLQMAMISTESQFTQTLQPADYSDDQRLTTLAPYTFHTPISLTRCPAVKEASPNNFGNSSRFSNHSGYSCLCRQRRVGYTREFFMNRSAHTDVGGTGMQQLK